MSGIVGLWSGKNYLKNYLIGSETMSKPNTADPSGSFFSQRTITHDLGYKPLVRGFYDPNNNGTIYNFIGNRSNNYFEFTSIVPFYFFADNITETSVTFRTYSFSSIGGTFTFYYRIYIDPTL